MKKQNAGCKSFPVAISDNFPVGKVAYLTALLATMIATILPGE